MSRLSRSLLLAALAWTASLTGSAQPAERLPATMDELAVLMQANPGAALAVLRANPAAWAGLAERTWQGRLVTVVRDDFRHGAATLEHYLEVNGQHTRLHASGELPRLSCPLGVEVAGYQIGDAILAAEVRAGAAEPTTAGCTTSGTQNVAVLMVQSATQTLPAGVTAAFLQSAFFGASGRSVDAFYRDASYGKASVGGAVFGPYTVADLSCASTMNLVQQALDAADSTVDFRAYTRIIVVAPLASSCSIGVGSIGCTSLSTSGDGLFPASYVLLDANFLTTNDAAVSVSAHEMGHNLGADHSYTRDYQTAPLASVGAAATDSEYYDVYAIMGFTYTISGQTLLGHFAPQHKVQFGWLSSGSDYLSVETGGEYTLTPYAAQTSGALKSLRVRRGTGVEEWLWLEYRQSLGLFDSTLSAYSSNVFLGALVRDERVADVSGASYLLNYGTSLSADTLTKFKTAVLPAGTTWNDPHTTLSLTTTTVGGGLKVGVAYRAPASGYTISGTVTLAGVPLSGVTLTLSGGVSSTASTDASGFFSFPGLPASGTYTVSAAKANYAFAPPSRTFYAITADYAADFAASTAYYMIWGTVTSGGSTLSGVTLSLAGSATATTTTDGSGNYSFSGLSAGNYTVTPSKTNYNFTPASRSFSPLSSNQSADFSGSTTVVTFTVSGTVTLSGAALSGVNLTLSGSAGGSTISAANGTYSFPGLAAGGSYLVTPLKVGYTFTPASRGIAGLATNVTADFAASLQAGYSISGLVTLNSAPLAGVSVALTGTQAGLATTDGSGAYSFTNLGAGGSYTITPSKAGYTFAPLSVSYANLGASQTAGFAATAVTATLQMNRSRLNFGAKSGGSATTPAQEVAVTTSAGTPWVVASDRPWLQVTPTVGTGPGRFTVSLNLAALPAAGSYSGSVTLSSSVATNSPRTLACTLGVYAGASAPFGSFDTPAAGSSAASSVAVTGWALDDIAVQRVEIYRDPVAPEPSGSLPYIGTAVFVSGSRPDVETAYPAYPWAYQAGWGYMLLTNFLPGGGNGTFRLYAIAFDADGHQTTLGSRTVTVDNAHATKPFGAIDTPAQGGTVAGSAYVNFGWALTPLPASIPTSGSTIQVFIDGVAQGHPVYNQARSDIQALFPGYANSSGAVGYFYVNTTRFADGVHTIAWTVRDSLGNADGIGSRYFTIYNNTASAAPEPEPDAAAAPAEAVFRTGYDGRSGWRKLGVIEVEELERVEIRLPRAGEWTAFVRHGDELRPLPTGSTWNGRAGWFVWQLGPGFLGEHELEFVSAGRSVAARVRIGPRRGDAERP